MFNPLTEEEAEIAKIGITPGVISWQVIEAQDKTFQSGNKGILLTLECQDQNGNIRKVYDNLIFTNNMIWKTRHFCAEAGLLDNYMGGNLYAKDCLNKMGWATLSIQKAKDGFAAKPIIDDYKVNESLKWGYNNKNNNILKQSKEDEDLPF